MSDALARRRVAPYIALAVAVVLAGLFVVLANGKAGTDDTAGIVDSPLLDRPAPSVKGVTTAGQQLDLSRRKGSWVVVNIFNSDCAPCKAEHADLRMFVSQQSTLGALGAELYTIAQGDTKEKVDAFFAERGGDWPVLLDEDGTISVAWARTSDHMLPYIFAGVLLLLMLPMMPRIRRGGELIPVDSK